MQEKVLLSVVVPVYNSEKFISACIESIINQTYENLEIILVDDGSTDNAGKICDKYALKDERIKCIHKQNEGACYARRDGILAASGEFITFVDSDDWIDLNMYEELLGVLLENNGDIITSGFTQDKEGVASFDLVEEGIYEGEKKEQLCVDMIYDRRYDSGGIMMSLCNKIYRRSLIVPYILDLPKHICLWEDIVYVYPPFIDAKKVLIIYKSFYHYRYNENSTSHRYDPMEYEKTVYTLNVARNVYQKFDKNILEAFYLENVLILYRYLWRCVKNEDERYRKISQIYQKFKVISKDDGFIIPVKMVLDIIPTKQERKFLKYMLEEKELMAINYCRYTIEQQKIVGIGLEIIYKVLGEQNIRRIKKLLGKE